MKIIQNEKGYALLLTFITIILIVIFTMSFSLRALNHNKLVEKTDMSYEATAVAEMGVEYFQARMLNLINKYQTPSTLEWTKVKNELDLLNYYINNTLPKDKGTKAYEDTIRKYRDNALGYLETDIGNLFNSYKNVEIPGTQFKITDVLSSSAPWEIELTGSSKEDNQVINVEFHLKDKNGNFELIILDASGGTINPSLPSVNITGITFNNLIPRRTNITNLAENVNPNTNFSGDNFIFNNNLENPNNTKIQSKGSVAINGINNMTSLDIYALGNVEIKNPIHAPNLNLYANNLKMATLNSLTNSKIEIENTATFGGMGNPVSNSKIQVNGNAKFDYFNNITNKSSIKINGATEFKYISMMEKDSEFLINGNLTTSEYVQKITDSLLKVMGTANFGNYIDGMSNSKLHVAGSANAGYLQNIKNNSELLIKGAANFGKYIQTMENSKIHIGGAMTVGYINNFKSGSSLTVNGDANFGAHIESIEGGSTIKVGGNATVGKVIMKDGHMNIEGQLTINGQNPTEISGGTIVVDSVNFTGNAVGVKESISVKGDDAKLCVRDFNNTSIVLAEKKSKATGKGKIIFLNTNRPKDYNEQIGLGSLDTGSHTREVGIDAFNSLCGITTNSATENYIINPNLPSANDVTKAIKYD